MERQICRVLDEAQRSKTAHDRLAAELLDFLSKDFQKAVQVFQTCLDCLVTVSKNEASVKTLMSFLATFCQLASKMQTDNAVDQETGAAADVVDPHPAALWLMAYSLTCSKAANKVVRMRGCEIGAIVMENFPEDADLSEEVWNASVAAALDRLSDKQSAVRLQAVRLCKRLQSPDDEEDAICARLMQMVEGDSSIQVRKAAVQAIAVTQQTLATILSRTRDVNDGVRAAVLDVVRESIPMPVLPIATRTKLLDQALRDTSESVRAGGVQLCTHWLQAHAFNDVAKFLGYLDVENLTRDSTSITQNMIRAIDSNSSLRCGPTGASIFRPEASFYAIEHGGNVSVEKAFLCRLVCEYLFEQKDEDRLEFVRPAMVDVADILKAAIADGNVSNEFVVKQVLMTVPFLDMQDEAGRREMVLQLKSALLNTDKIAEDNVTATLEAFMAAYHNKQDFMRYMVELCAELREPIEEYGLENLAQAADALNGAQLQEGDDDLAVTVSEVWDMQSQLRDLRWREEEKDEVLEHEEEIQDLTTNLENVPEVLGLQIRWIRCLNIVSFLFEHSRSNLPELEALYSGSVLPALQQSCPELREVAVKCLGLFSCLNEKEAGANLELLRQFAMTDLTPIRLVALKSAADMLTVFPSLLAEGKAESIDMLTTFIDILDSNGDMNGSTPEADDEFDDMEDERHEVHEVAVKTLAKFLLLGRVKKHPGVQKQILAKLLVSCFIVGDQALPVALKQFLSVFFASYTHQSGEVRSLFVNCVADVVSSVSFAGAESANGTADVCAILQYVTHVVTQSAIADKNGGGAAESDFLRARIVMDLLIELCACPEQPHGKEVARFVAGIVSSSPGCCAGDRVAAPLCWVAAQLSAGKGGSAMSSLARKVMKASSIDSDAATQANNPQFQTLKMRIMARRATINSLRVQSRCGKTGAASTAQSVVAASDTTTAEGTIAKSRAMLARMKKAIGRKGDTEAGALQPIENTA
mgnify:CR=1 FL=1